MILARNIAADQTKTPNELTLPIMINCGGSDLIDEQGNHWHEDAFYYPTEPHSMIVSTSETIAMAASDEHGSTMDSRLYANAREFKRRMPSPYKYEIPMIKHAHVKVVIHFAEINPTRFGRNKRKVNVLVEDILVANEFDIFEMAGDGFTPITISTEIVVTDGFLTIELGQVIFNPCINAIQIFALSYQVEPSVVPSLSKSPSTILTKSPSMLPSFIPSEILSMTPSGSPSKSLLHTKTPIIPSPSTPNKNYSTMPSSHPAGTTSTVPISSSFVPTSIEPLPSQGWNVIETIGIPEKRHEACFVMTENGKAYLIGGRGLKSVNVFDPKTNEWSREPGPGQQLHHMQCVVADHKIWIVSAWKGNCCNERNEMLIWIYDTIHQSWTTRAGLSRDRSRGAAAAVLYQRHIYLVGGARGGHADFRETVAWMDRYSLDEDIWTTLPNAPHARDHTGGAIVNEHLLCVAGGRDGAFNDTVSATDCYDLRTGQWLTMSADIPQGRAGSAYGQSCDGKLLVAGGEGFGHAWDRVDSFDGTRWELVGRLSIERHGTSLAIDCRNSCQSMYIASGSGAQGGRPELESTEAYTDC